MSAQREYGLPSTRDSDGDLLPVDHTYDFRGQAVTIRAVPPTIGELDQYEQLGADVSFGDLYDIVDKHLVKPELPGKAETSGPELTCYLQGIMNVGAGDSTALAVDVQEELAQRDGGTGN